MSDVRPWRGSVEAHAVLLDRALLGDAETARRLFALWEPGARLERSRAGVIVVLARPRRVAVSGAPGLPLVLRTGALIGFSASDALVATLAPPAGALVLLDGGRPVVLLDGRPSSPADWLELGAVEMVATTGLAERAPVVLDPPPVATVHEALGPSVPAPAPERQALLREAAGGGNGSGGNGDGVGVGPGEAGGAPGDGGSWWSRLFDRASDLLGFHRLLGRRYGRYLARMMEMLEGGDVGEGLRHAIPLASVKDLAERHRAGGLWRLPRARDGLDISPGRAPVGGVGLEAPLFARLRELYRAVFARLDAQGRHAEAAFVLAELLQEDEEAVAYLERHGEFQRAAALAEARRCAPGLVVRAWFLAGDRARAVSLARRRGAFHDAIVRLESSYPAEAKALRLLWADALAEAGDYAEAVATVRQYPEARSLVLRWIDTGLALGEAQAPRLCAFEAALAPERWPEILTRAEAWLTPGDAASAPRRRALAEALPTVPATPATRLLARRCARACLAGASDDRPPTDARTLQALVRFAGDAALETDLPARTYHPGSDWRAGETLTATIDRGNGASLRDAVVLPSGRLLVAEGDAGVSLRAASGSVLHHFDVPADRLIPSDTGDRAIALARRGDSAQLARLELRVRQATPWGLVRLQAFADGYDGNVWFVSDRDRLLALDTQADEPSAFWSMSEPEGEVFASVVRDRHQVVAIAASFGIERWSYELPSLTLRGRQPLAFPPSSAPVLHLGPTLAGPTFGLTLDPSTNEFVVSSVGAQRHERRFPAAAAAHTAAATDELFALCLPENDGLRLRLFGPTLTLHADLQLPGAKEATLRFAFRHLVIARHDGRLTTLDLDSGTLRTALPR